MVSLYDFDDAPPKTPALHFNGKQLRGLAMYGSCSCPYAPPQFTVFPSDGQVGRWTLHFDVGDALRLPDDPKQWWDILERTFPGMRMRYEDFETGHRWIWVLTDRMVHNKDTDYWLGVWPD